MKMAGAVSPGLVGGGSCRKQGPALGDLAPLQRGRSSWRPGKRLGAPSYGSSSTAPSCTFTSLSICALSATTIGVSKSAPGEQCPNSRGSLASLLEGTGKRV